MQHCRFVTAWFGQGFSFLDAPLCTLYITRYALRVYDCVDGKDCSESRCYFTFGVACAIQKRVTEKICPLDFDLSKRELKNYEQIVICDCHEAKHSIVIKMTLNKMISTTAN